MIQDIIDSKAKFIREYMNDHNFKIRWLRSIFMDEEEKINAILDCMDNIEEKAKAEQHKLLQSIVEMVEKSKKEVPLGLTPEEHEEVRAYNSVYNQALDSFKAKLLKGKNE
jgi:hypothetical protein